MFRVLRVMHDMIAQIYTSALGSKNKTFIMQFGLKSHRGLHAKGAEL